MKLDLFYYRQCPFCLRVLNKIDELELNSFINLKNTLENNEYREEHITKTNRSTVPCLYIDDAPMFESQDICEWLEQNQNNIKA